MNTYLHSGAARVGLATIMEEPSQPSFVLGVFMMERSIMWRTRLSVRLSDYDPVSEITLFVGFNQIQYKNSLSLFVELDRISLKKSPQ
jgi:hypothetical protein